MAVKILCCAKPANKQPTHMYSLQTQDPKLYEAVLLENARQEQHIELIASENYASRAVMEAQGSQLTNKYAEGYPGRRYYGGCEQVLELTNRFPVYT